MPQILTVGTLLIIKLCCELDNHATENGLARSSSVLPVNHIFFRTHKFRQLSRQLAIGMIRFENKKL